VNFLPHNSQTFQEGIRRVSQSDRFPVWHVTSPVGPVALFYPPPMFSASRIAIHGMQVWAATGLPCGVFTNKVVFPHYVFNFSLVSQLVFSRFFTPPQDLSRSLVTDDKEWTPPHLFLLPSAPLFIIHHLVSVCCFRHRFF